MIYVETSPIEVLFWGVIILGLLTLVACVLALCYLANSSNRRKKPIKVVVRKKVIPKKVSVAPVLRVSVETLKEVSYE